MSAATPQAGVLVRSDLDATVQQIARVVATTLGVELRGIDPSSNGDGRVLARELDRSGALTLASRVDDVAWAVVQEAATPVLLVPVAVDRVTPRLRRVLAPLDGSPDAAAALRIAARFVTGELVVLHVLGPGEIPRFWDDPAHAERAWCEEFRARWCDRPGTRVELRTGRAAERVPEVAHDEAADLVVLGWSQRLDDGHAPVVRHAVARADVPILLVPIGRAPR